MTTCKRCTGPVTQPVGRGRPRLFCSRRCCDRYYQRVAVPEFVACRYCVAAMKNNRNGTKRYCSDRCIQAAYRLRKAEATT